MLEIVKIIVLLLVVNNSFSSTIWPSPNWEISISQNFKKVDDYAFSKDASYKTDGLLVIYKGKIVFEKYSNGYSSEKLHLLWSTSKSVTSLLTGILVKEGRISVDEDISSYYPAAKGITVKHLLNMSSSIDWNEGYEGNPLNSNVIQMLYTSGRSDMDEYTSKIKRKGPSGTIFKYSSGETNLLMGFIKNKISNKEIYENLPWEKIFIPLGIKEATWERDKSGTFIGSSYLYLTPRDFARIGYLYLREGKWKNKEIISEAWVYFSRAMAQSFVTTTLDGDSNAKGYGAIWWLNETLSEKGLIRPYPDAPEDLFMALGHHGQILQSYLLRI